MLIGAHLPFDAPALGHPESQGFHQALRALHWGLPGCQWRGDAFLVGNAQAQTAQGQHVLFTGHIQNRAELRTSLGLLMPMMRHFMPPPFRPGAIRPICG